MVCKLMSKHQKKNIFDESDLEIIFQLIEKYKKLIENFSTVSNDNLEPKLLKDQFPFNLDLQVINFYLKKYNEMMKAFETVKH